MVSKIALVAHNGNYLVATGDGGHEMQVVSDSAGKWETFGLFNQTRPGQEFHHGDQVVLQAWNSRFLSANGDGSVRAESGWVDLATKFTIESLDGSGVIRSGEQVAFRAANGHYVVAVGGGAGALNATGTRRGDWETFTMKMFGTQLIRLRSSANRYVTAEDGGGSLVTANREGVGRWETFSLVNFSRSDRTMLSGDVVALQTWSGKFIEAGGTGPAIVSAGANRTPANALFTIRAAGGEAIGHGQRVQLQSRASSRFLAARSEVMVADGTADAPASFFTLELAEQAGIDFRWVPEGNKLPDRPFASLPEPVTGTPNLLVLHIYTESGNPRPITASNDQIRDAVFGRPPSLQAWLQAMSGGVFGVSDAGVYGPLRVGEDQSVDSLLTAAEEAGAPLASFARDGVIDNNRVKLAKLGVGAGGQLFGAAGTSRRGIRFSGRMAGVGVSPDVNEGSRMVLCHEISHMVLDVVDRYGIRRLIRGDVIANRTWVGGWERYTLVRLAGPGPVRAGDRIFIRAHDGRYLAADPEWPHLINTEEGEPDETRAFTISKLDGSGVITSGEKVTFRSAAGLYMTAEKGGNSVVTANRTAVGGWEPFEIAEIEGEGSIESGAVVSLKTSGGFYVVAETNTRDRPRDPATDAKDRKRGYIWGAGLGQGGGFDNASANYRAVMLSLWDRFRLGWVRPRYLTPDNRGCYVLRPFLESRQALILFDPLNPREWYTVENRQYRENEDEVPSSGIVISWICEDEGYWRWWFNAANDEDPGLYPAGFPAVISAAAPSVPPNMMAREVLLHDDSAITKRNDPNAAFTNQELVLPLGNGDPSRFHLTFHPLEGGSVAFCIR